MTKVPLFLERGLSTVMVEEDLQAGWLLIFPRGRGLESLGKRHDDDSVSQQTAGCTMSCNLYRKRRLVRRKARCKGNAEMSWSHWGWKIIKHPTATYLTPHLASRNIHHDYSAV